MMKLRTPLRSVLVACLTAATSLQAQEFTIDWHSIDGGGGTSTGGGFSLSGTIGQPDADAQAMTGGVFSLRGGFWSLLTAETPDTPRITIRLNSQRSLVLISWPSNAAGFVLQQTSDLKSAPWINAPDAVADNTVTKSIAVNPVAGQRFYRLFKP